MQGYWGKQGIPEKISGNVVGEEHPGGTFAPDHPSEIATELQQLAQAAGDLADMTVNFEARLGPVLRPPHPEAVPSEPEDTPQTEVGLELRRVRLIVDHTRALMFDYQQRLAL